MTACLLCQSHPRRAEVPLCADCEGRIRTALREAPALYVRGVRTWPALRAALSEKLSTPKPGSRPPGVNLLLELCDSLARALAAWELHTTVVAGLPLASLLVRPGFGVQRSAAAVSTHLAAAMAPPYGLAHAGHVLTLIDTLRERLGLNLLVHQLAAPCPQCDMRALVRRDGDGHVSCRMCGQTWPERRYELLTRVLVAQSAAAGGRAC